MCITSSSLKSTAPVLTDGKNLLLATRWRFLAFDEVTALSFYFETCGPSATWTSPRVLSGSWWWPGSHLASQTLLSLLTSLSTHTMSVILFWEICFKIWCSTLNFWVKKNFKIVKYEFKGIMYSSPRIQIHSLLALYHSICLSVCPSVLSVWLSISYLCVYYFYFFSTKWGGRQHPLISSLVN